MPRFVLRNRRIVGLGQAHVAELSVRTGVGRLAIVGVDDVARRAAALAVVAGRVVRAEERHDRVVQSDFLGPEDDRIHRGLRPEAAIREVMTAAGVTPPKGTDARTIQIYATRAKVLPILRVWW